MLIKPQELIQLLGIAPKEVLHCGAYLCEERDLYKNMGVNRVLWVEADPLSCASIRALLRDYNHGQELVECAVHNKDNEELVFHICNNRSCSSLKHLAKHLERYPHIVHNQDVKVHTKTIDTLCKEYKLTPNLINLDLQGHEFEALSGAFHTLSSPTLKCVYTEVSFEELYEGCRLISDIDGLLFRFGFERVKTFDTGCGWADSAYIRNDL